MPTVTSSSHHIVAAGDSGAVGAALGGVVVGAMMHVVMHLVLVSAGNTVSHKCQVLPVAQDQKLDLVAQCIGARHAQWQGEACSSSNTSVQRFKTHGARPWS